MGKLTGIDTALRSAVERASGFAVAQNVLEGLDGQLEERRSEIDIARRRIGELERIDACWPTWRKREDSATRLSALGSVTPAMQAALEHATELHELSVRLSGHNERVRRRDELIVQCGGIERELASCLEDVNSDDHLRTVRLSGVPIEIRDEIRRIASQSHDLIAELHALGAEVDRAEELAVRLRAELARVATVERDVSEVASMRSETRELRRLVQHRDRIEADLLTEERETRLLNVEFQRQRTSRSPSLGSLGAVVAIGFGIASTYAAYHHDSVVAIVGLLAMIAVAFFSFRTAFQQLHRADLDTIPVISSRRDEIDLLGQQISKRALALSLVERPSLAEVELLEARLDEEMVAAQLRADIEGRATEATQRATRARRPVLERTEKLEVASRRVRELCLELDLPATLSAEALSVASDQLVRARDLSRARQRVDAEIMGLSGEIDRYEAGIKVILTALGVDDDHLSEEVDRKVAVVSHLLEEAIALDQQRIALESAINSADEVLRDTLGDDAIAARLHRELSLGATTSWSNERTRTTERLSELGVEYERLVSARRDAERHLEDLLQSDEIARLELERNSVQTALDDALVEYTTLGIAKSLLSSTLTRYEQERQPAVIARAANLFRTITDERYQRVVARAEDDGRHQRVEVLSRSGERVSASELSRGSAEQLYLCLRFALAEAFAERAVALPFVLDDILVNFDPARAQAVARVITQVSLGHQVIAFTCHPHVVELFTSLRPDVSIVEMTPAGRAAALPGQRPSSFSIGASLA